MVRKSNEVIEWDVPGRRLDPNAHGHSPGIVLGVSRQANTTLRMGASKPPRDATTFGVLHTLTVSGGDNVLHVPGRREYCGLSDPTCARDAIAAYRTQRVAR